MKKCLCIYLLFVFLIKGVNAQQQTSPIRCGTMQHLELLKAKDPTIEARMKAVEQEISNYIAAHPMEKMKTTITIPVVFHVVYNLPEQNLPDTLLTTQIDVLNEDYNNLNSDLVKVPTYFRSRIGNVGIHFALATRDPNGNATSGIVRTVTSVTSFSLNDAIKSSSTGGDDAWNSAEYFNVWIGNLNGGLLGYSQFPGGVPATDGCVIHYTTFGRISSEPGFDYGRTLTHESGHWLNLYHVWGDAYCGNDSVADTPTQMTATSGPQNCQVITCNNGPLGNLYQDFMDYTDDRFMVMLTQGQVARMMAVMNTVRASLLSSNGLNIVSSPNNDAGITDILIPAMTPCVNSNQIFTPEVVLKNWGTNVLTSVTINSRIDYSATKSVQWTGSLAAGASITVSYPDDTSTVVGDHIYYCWTSNPNGGNDANKINDRRTISFITKNPNTTFPISMGFEPTTFPPANWTIKNYDCTVPWQRTTAASHSDSACAVMKNFQNNTSIAGHWEDLITQPIDLSGSKAPVLYFWVAYAPYSYTVTDTLEILISRDCFDNETSMYKKWGTTLQTATPQATVFIPNPFQWRLDSIDLSPYFPTSNAQIIFRNHTAMGNNFYLDDIRIANSDTINPTIGNTIYFFPNPTHGVFNVGFKLANAEQVQITVFDILGQKVYESKVLNVTHDLIPIYLQDEAKGVYMVQVKTNSETIIKKLILD